MFNEGEVSPESNEIEHAELYKKFNELAELCGLKSIIPEFNQRSGAIIESKGSDHEDEEVEKLQNWLETQVDQSGRDRPLALIGGMALNASLNLKLGWIESVKTSLDVEIVFSYLSMSRGSDLEVNEVYKQVLKINELIEKLS